VPSQDVNELWRALHQKRHPLTLRCARDFENTLVQLVQFLRLLQAAAFCNAEQDVLFAGGVFDAYLRVFFYSANLACKVHALQE